MPLYKEWSPNDHSLAAIWHIEEEEPFFLDIENIRNAINVGHIKHPRRRLEHLAGRYLLQHLKADFPLHHIAADEHDKPRLPENQYFFSISHSHPYVAALISDREECGIDIQVWHKRIESIAHMFLSAEERKHCKEDARLLTLAWCAKEAAYKWNGRRGADFIRDLPIESLHKTNSANFSLDGPEPFSIDMRCFGLHIFANALIHNDFAMSYLVRHHE